MNIDVISNSKNGARGGKFKMVYEELKNRVGYEDIFYENYLKPECDRLNLEIKFEGKHIIFVPKGE
ncbi:MAG: hypothetical protein RR744_00335 [Cellulosilyticaceae bacterium]